MKQLSFTSKKKNCWVLELDAASVACFKPAGLTQEEAFQDQMMMYSTLEWIFDEINPSLFEAVDFTDSDFCTKIFAELDLLWKPEGCADEAALLD